jgi:hypothetical protein
MWISDHVKRSRAAAARNIRAVLDEQLAMSSTPKVRLNKERVYISVSVAAGQNRRKPDDVPGTFGDEDKAAGELLERNVDRVRVFE